MENLYWKYVAAVNYSVEVPKHKIYFVLRCHITLSCDQSLFLDLLSVWLTVLVPDLNVFQASISVFAH